MAKFMTNLMLWDDLRCYLVRFAPFQFFLLYDGFLSLFIDDPKLLLRKNVTLVLHRSYIVFILA